MADAHRIEFSGAMSEGGAGKGAQHQTSSREIRSAGSCLRKYGRAAANAPLLLRCILSRSQIRLDDLHILAALEWLLRAQQIWGNKGFAHSYSFVQGWVPPYPETTGYLIPTLYRCYLRYQAPELLESVLTATDWLYEIQQADGSFADLEGNAQVFDTAQVLTGFNYIAEHLIEQRRDAAISSAAKWLCSVQEPDGSFVSHAYNGRAHSYYSRVGAALIKAGHIIGVKEFEEAGKRNLEWTILQQDSSGFFSRLSFDDRPPFLHTMVYVMEGLLEGHEWTGDRRYLDAVLRFADRLLEISNQRDLVLRSQYCEDFSVSNPEKCLTGLVQWAGVCFRLFGLTGNSRYREEACKSVYYVKSKQLFVPHEDVYGGLPGSAPIGGRYLRYSLPNWGLKFFVDALLLKVAM